MVVTKVWGEEGNEELFNGYRVSVMQNENFWRSITTM